MLLDTSHLSKSPCRPSTPPCPWHIPMTLVPPSKALRAATLQKLLRNFPRNVTQSSQCWHGFKIPQTLIWLSVHVSCWSMDDILECCCHERLTLSETISGRVPCVKGHPHECLCPRFSTWTLHLISIINMICRWFQYCGWLVYIAVVMTQVSNVKTLSVQIYLF